MSANQPTILALLLMTAAGLTGCVRPIPPAPPSSASTGQWLAACRQELRERGFAIEAIDYRAGEVISVPLVSKQWFEFWRRDVGDAAGVAESSLHTVRRTVRCRLAGPDQLICQVQVERLHTRGDPQTRVQSNAPVMLPHRFVFSERSAAFSQWVTIDQGDPALEIQLTQAINRRFKAQEPHT